PGHPKFSIALESVRDLQLLEFILDHVPHPVVDPKVISAFQKIVSDATLPELGGDRSNGRDTQFELYVYAVCCAAGMSNVCLNEPDIVCTAHGIEWKIAAKRIKKTKKFMPRLSEGAKQVAQAGAPGVIIVDSCLMFNPENNPVGRGSEEVFINALANRINKFVKTQYHQMVNSLAHKSVLGVLIHDHNVKSEEGDDWNLKTLTFHVPVFADGGHEDPRFKAFREMYVSPLPNVKPTN
ncbi:MAG: hypothetical protein ACRDHZ_24620, partial [Ktedonobacteraceae bacterium]